STVQLLGNLGEFTGAIAVVVTLVYLASQIRQNTNSLNAGSVYKSAELSSNSEMALTGDDAHIAWSKALEEPNKLSRGELFQTWAIMSLAAQSALQTYRDYLEGLASEDRWLFARGLFISHINHPVGMIYWEEIQQDLNDEQTRSFAASVEEGIASSPPYAMRSQFLRAREKVSSLPDRFSSDP
ncbi:MAG: hypothetical protein ACWGQW_26615, partial [bacterium]